MPTRLEAHLARPDDLSYVAADGTRLVSARPGCDGHIDEVGLAEQLLASFPSDVDRTPCAGLRRVHRDQTGRACLDATASDSELTSSVWSAVRGAVESSLGGARKVAIALGGSDSSGILAAACELRPASELTAYTYDYDGGADVPFARELCQAYGVEHRLLRLDDVLPDLAKGLVIDGLPFWCLPGAHELQFLSVLARDPVDLLLTGGYGDDILGGEASMLSSSFLRHPLRTLDRMRRLRTPGSSGLGHRIRRMLVAPLAQRALPAPLRSARVRRGFRARAPWLSESVFRLGEGGMRASARGYLAPRDAIEWRAELVRRTSRYIGARAQLAAQSGIARADPYVSSEFIASLAEVPFERLCLADEYRGLFRRALPPRVPSSVRFRLTKANASADLRRIARLGAPSLRPFASVDRLARLGLVDRPSFQRAFEQVGASAPFIWSVLSAEAFLRESS